MVAETGIGIIISVTAVIFYFQSIEANDKHTGIKLLYNMSCLWILLLGSWITVEMAENDGLSSNIITNLTTFYWILLTVVIFITCYWVFMYLKDVFVGMVKRKRQKFLDNEDVQT